MNSQPSGHPADQPGASPYTRGARDGLVFGLFLSVMFLSTVYSGQHAWLSLVAFAMMMAVPFIIYRCLRRSYVTDGGTTLLSSLWMHGIMIFLCGAIISGLVEVVWFKYVNPGFVVEQMKLMIELYSDYPWERGREVASLLQSMIDNNMVPTTMAIVTEMIWLSVFSGSLLSVLMAVLVRARKLPTPTRKN